LKQRAYVYCQRYLQFYDKQPEIMSIVNEIYKEDYSISEDKLLAKVIDIPELTAEDLWLLPQYVFDEWRKKHDYPRILDNFKRRFNKFTEWMQAYSLTDEILMDGYISSFIRNKYTEGKNDLKFHLVLVTYKGKSKHQVWYSYDKNKIYNAQNITYEYKGEFISYFDWCESNNIENIEINVERLHQASVQEQVYYNFDLKLLKMGGIEPLKNGLGQILRPKKIEFVNLNGLKLSDEINNNKSIEFIFSTVDNLICSHLKVFFITFDNSSVRNLYVENSDISNWDFINSNTSGRIKDSSTKNFRIWGGQFIPVFENTEPEGFDVYHSNLKHSTKFDRTYRALYKANNETGNYKEANKFKILELDYKRSNAAGFFNKASWMIDKYFWGYGKEPKRIILFSSIIILFFGLLLSLISHQIIPDKLLITLNSFEIVLHSIYCSVVTFVTLGYSDIYPTYGLARFIISIEAILGALSMGALVVTLTKMKE